MIKHPIHKTQTLIERISASDFYFRLNEHVQHRKRKPKIIFTTKFKNPLLKIYRSNSPSESISKLASSIQYFILFIFTVHGFLFII